MDDLATSSPVLGHTARAILTLLRGAELSGKELADALQVSAQTASVLTRDLASAGLIVKGKPKRGKVGKPQTPWALHADGAYSIGLRIGRRSADFVLMDLTGAVRRQDKLRYPVPTPEVTEDFLRRNLQTTLAQLGPNADRLSGFGIAAPYQLWTWIEGFEPAPEALDTWRDYSFTEAIARLSPLPVTVANDATMACQGELLFGAGRGARDFAYIHIGALLGGGLVLNGRVYEGAHRNAGDFAAIPVTGGRLSGRASLAQLETRLAERLGRAVNLGTQPELWQAHPDDVSGWLNHTASAIAEATIALRAILDLPQIIIDGGMPEAVKTRLVAQVTAQLQTLDQRGLHPVHIIAGHLGDSAGALGAANLPLLGAHFLQGGA